MQCSPWAPNSGHSCHISQALRRIAPVARLGCLIKTLVPTLWMRLMACQTARLHSLNQSIRFGMQMFGVSKHLGSIALQLKKPFPCFRLPGPLAPGHYCTMPSHAPKLSRRVASVML